MTVTSAVLLAVVVAALIVVTVLTRIEINSLRGKLSRTRAKVNAMAAEVDSAPFDLSKTLGDGRRKLITIEILNPLEVAANESKLARRIGPVAPNLIRGEVTRQAVRELETQLAAQGIEAEVRVHDGR